MFSLQLHFDHLQCAENEEREKAARNAETNLSAAETQADHGYKPVRGGGRETLDIVAAFQDGSAADETHTGQNAEGKRIRSSSTNESELLPTLFISQFACSMARQAAKATSSEVLKPAECPSISRSKPIAPAASMVSKMRRPTSGQVTVNVMDQSTQP